MADLAELGTLDPPIERDDGITHIEEDRGPEPPRYTDFMPRSRGVLKPELGPITSRSVVRALALGGSGWLHRDGRILASGSERPMDAMRRLPEAAPIFEAWDRKVADLKVEYDIQYKRALAKHQASEWSDSRFKFDDDHLEAPPESKAHRALEGLGWLELTLRQDRGVKEIHFDHRIDEFWPLEEHLRVLATDLDCRVVKDSYMPDPYVLFDRKGVRVDRRVASVPERPSPSRSAASRAAPPQDAVLPRLNEIPGFKSFDPVTGAIEIEGWGRTILVPGVPAEAENEGPTPGF